MNDKTKSTKSYLYAKDSKTLQISYAEYKVLVEKVEEAQHIQEVKEAVLSDLREFLGGSSAILSEPSVPKPEPRRKSTSSTKEKKVSSPPVVSEKKTVSSNKKTASKTKRAEMPQVPPIKKEIAKHFNNLDESGRLFNVFKQYYTCLNEACGGMMRVTMKDGICSLWNYDEWEEFSFVDIFENHLRVAVDPIYTDELKSLSLCEVPRLLSNSRNLICVQVDDLNNRVLEVLVKAFNEAGMQVK